MASSFAEFLSGADTSAPSQPSYSPNVSKFLNFLGNAEDADYNTIVGGGSFSDFSKHPGVVGTTTSEGPSTAAGKYQITHTTYKTYADKLGITDFSPESQDKIALELIKDKGAMKDVESGNYDAAIKKLGSTWASLPSSPYKQGKRSQEWVNDQLGTTKGSFKDFLAAPEPTKETVKGTIEPTQKKNWAATGPEMSFKDYLSSGFAGRLVTGAVRSDDALMKQADDAVVSQYGKAIKDNPKKYKELWNVEYKKLKTDEANKIEAEKKAAGPEPTVSESLQQLGKDIISHPIDTAKGLIYELGKDPELALLGPGAEAKVAESAVNVGRAAKLAKNAAEVGKTMVKAGATGVGLETAAEIGDQRGLDLQRIENTGASFATLAGLIHGGAKAVKSVTGTPRVVTPEADIEKLNNTLNEHAADLTTEGQPVEAQPIEQVHAEADQEVLQSPTLQSAGDVFEGKDTPNKSPIEAIKATIRNLNFNNRASKLWRAAIEKAVPDSRIRERMTMAIEADRPYDKLLTDAEKADTIAKLSRAADVLESKANIGDEATQADNAAKLSRIRYVVDKLRDMPSEEHAMPILKAVEGKLAEIGEKAKTEGLIDQLRQNYVTHVLNFTESALNKEQIRTLMDRLFGEPKDSRFVRDFSEHRIYRTIRDLEDRIREYGDEMGIDTRGVKVERDISKIAEIYHKAMMTAVYQKRLLNYLGNQHVKNLAGKEIPLVTNDPKIAFDNNYVKFEGRGSEALKDYAVHPDIVDPLKFLFRQSDPNLFLRALGSISMLSKFLNTMGSLFHATSLFVARATSRPGDMIKEVFTAGAGTRMALEELEHNGASKSVELAMKSGLQIATEDVQRGILTDIANTTDKILADYTPVKEGTKVLRRVTDPVEDLFLAKMNRFTWDYMHAAGKLHLWQQWFTKIKSRNPELPDEEVARQVSSFVNNTLGGLDWLEVADQTKNKYLRAFAMKAFNIQGRDWAQIALFAPDWTLSTLRSFTKALPEELNKPKNWQLREGVKGLFNPKNQGDLARRYVLNTAIAWLTILNGFNIAFTGRPIWTNKDPTRVDLGDGTSMQMAKHSMEAAEWLHDPEKTLGNKLGFWPKAVITMTTGKAYPSPRAPMIKDNTALGRLEHSLSAALPFQISAAVNAPAGERAKRSFASFLGVPIYGQTNKQHTSPEVLLERKQQRKETRMANKQEKMKRKQ